MHMAVNLVPFIVNTNELHIGYHVLRLNVIATYEPNTYYSAILYKMSSWQVG